MVVTMGNPMVDYIVERAREEVVALGLIPGGECPERFRTDHAGAAALLEGVAAASSPSAPCTITPGGAALNTARAAKVYLNRQTTSPPPAIQVASIGCVGYDTDADLLTEACTRVGVQPLFTKPEDASIRTGRSLILITPDGDRSIVGIPAAGRSLCAEQLVGEVAEVLGRTTILYITSFTLTTPPRVLAAGAAVKALKLKEKRVCYNLSAATIQRREIVVEAIRAALKEAYLLVGNVGEAEAFCQAQGLCDKERSCSAAEAVGLIGAAFPGLVVLVTDSAQPTQCVVPGGDIMAFPVPVLESAVVDTAGAGDCFAAGVLAQLATHFAAGSEPNWGDCIAAGHQSAAVVITRKGCQIE